MKIGRNGHLSYFLVPETMSPFHVRSKVCMAPFNVRRKVCIAPIKVRSKFEDFAPHIEGCNADFSPHMEGSHVDSAPHMERIPQMSMKGYFDVLTEHKKCDVCKTYFLQTKFLNHIKDQSIRKSNSNLQ